MGRPVFKLKRITDINDVIEINSIQLGEHFTMADSGEIYYRHHTSGYIFGPIGGGNVGGGGAGTVIYQNANVYITDVSVVNPEAVLTKTYDSQTDNLTVLSFTTSDTVVRVSVIALATDISYKPTVTINSTPANLNNVGICQWEGFADIDISALANGSNITARINGNINTGSSIIVNKLIPPAVSNTTRFVNGYPNGQTEVKENDIVEIQVEASQLFNAVEVVSNANNGIKPVLINCLPTSILLINGIVDNIGSSVAIARGVVLRVRSLQGVWSPVVNTITFGGPTPLNGVHTIPINNAAPVITFSGITYPTDATINKLQGALKYNETATVEHTISNFDVVTYSSTAGNLDVTNLNIYESSKSVKASVPNDYDVGNNLTIMATLESNGAVTIYNVKVKVMDATPTLSVIKFNGRFRSGGNNGTTPQSYLITIQSDQEMHPDMPISLDSSVISWNGAWNRTSSTEATNTLVIHDNHPKTTYSLDNPIGHNLAGKPVSVSVSNSSIVLGGFVKRTIQLNDGEREKNFGALAVNPAKLVCTNYSYNDTIGSYTYSPTTDNVVGTYSINGGGVTYANGIGTVWRNNDNINFTVNTTFMYVEIEELS